MKLDIDSPHPKTLTADHGVYDEDTRLLRLDGHVRVDDAAASTVGTEEALVDTKAGTGMGRGWRAGSSRLAGRLSASQTPRTTAITSRRIAHRNDRALSLSMTSSGSR